MKIFVSQNILNVEFCNNTKNTVTLRKYFTLFFTMRYLNIYASPHSLKTHSQTNGMVFFSSRLQLLETSVGNVIRLRKKTG